MTTNALVEHIGVLKKVIREQTSQIEDAAQMILAAVDNDRKILVCGNGGSAADAQHIATEFVVRYEAERRAVPAIALTTDTSALTASANDYSFEHVFSRQIEALAAEGDVLIAISTSGNSPNVIKAVMAARNKGCSVVGLTGKNGKKLAALCDVCVMVPAEKTSRIQEAHITIGHILCETVDRKLAQES
ncbi:MAG: D-sedoheptulose 7-phosphate isomerase [Pyrinomonadaceae bacterium]|nr:D-sedoheptulose 7-phosphate isomerase [Pyrinomonadaceae bacterium]